ncbi:MAG: YdeI/OmpD-associated family protein [Chitinophagaceae bacterium]|nr:YdeI/OmpD-associated family protein [Chitinophagaceae bacterium]
MNTDKRIDAYILKSQPFAQPILHHLRALVHHACPEVEEKIKWSFPNFDYKGSPLCSMAAFKQHCAFGFWKAGLMKDKALQETAQKETAMGHLGRICTLEDLPSDKKILAWIKEAMKLNDAGINLPKKAKPAPPQIDEIPSDFLQALKKNKAAEKTFHAFSASCKREYLTWITEAKTEPTRLKRLTQAIEWMAEGKKRNWKYER